MFHLQTFILMMLVYMQGIKYHIESNGVTETETETETEIQYFKNTFNFISVNREGLPSE